jgi:nucleotide-binding universal stress UspA family protein
MNSSIQRILLPLDPSPHAEAATLRACDIAHRHFAQITGLAVLDSPEIRRCFSPVEVSHWPSVRANVDLALDEARETIARAEERFASICDQHHVAHTEAELEGVPASLITEMSGLYDLMVIGLRTFFHFETREGAGDSLVRVLDRTACPVLAVPARPAASFERVVIAYDGSFPASRALRDFVGFARPMGFRITLFSAGGDRAQGEALLERAGAYLRSHDLGDFSVHVSDRAPWDAFRDELLEETDLLVAGIHSRKFLVDPFIGSFTKQLIDLDRIPLFLSH